jgi:hypothetical protein
MRSVVRLFSTVEMCSKHLSLRTTKRPADRWFVYQVWGWKDIVLMRLQDEVSQQCFNQRPQLS